jgi:ferredoxin-type protein NapH
MGITRLRWSTQVVSFFVLLLGGMIGISLGFFLPTLSCPYVGQSRGGDCFLLNLQFNLAMADWARYKVLGLHFLWFSLLVIILGRFWCGWICPFGFVQDVLDLIRRKLHVGYISFSERFRDKLRWIKWAFLFIVLLVPLCVAFPFFAPEVACDLRQPFCQLCPARYVLPLVVGNPGEVAVNFKSATTITMTVLGLSLAIGTIIGAMAKRRFWCPYCPMGLLLSLYRKISLIKLKKDCQKCTMCEVCYNVCPVEIKQIFKEREKENVTFGDCMLCLRCIENCPEDGVLRADFLGKTVYRSTSRGFFHRKYNIPIKKNHDE